MKKFVLIIVAIQFSLLLFSQVWVQMHVDSTDSDFFDVTFIDENIGYIVGGDSAANSAVMYYTDDGGVTWIDTNFSVYALWSVQFLNSQTGYVATLNANPANLIFKTIDGGASWTAITTAINNDGKIYFKNTSLGFHYSTDNADDVAYTTDGGDTWTKYPGGTFGGNGVAEIQFPEGNSIGYAITSSSGKIYKTTSDTAWSLLSAPSLKDYNAMYFISDLVGYVIGDDIILKTVDGGSNWTTPNSTEGGLDIFSFTADECRILSSEAIKYSIDAGSNLSADTIWDTGVSGLTKLSNSNVGFPAIAVGQNGKAYIYSVLEGLNQNETGAALSIYPNPVADGSFTIKLSNTLISDGQIFIYDLNGKLLQQEKIFEGENEINITTRLPNGLYFLQLHGDNNRYSEKLLIGK